MVPSLNVPVAVNCWVPPTASVGAKGVIAIETNVPVPTVRVVVPLTPELEAVIVTTPLFFPSARPKRRTDTTLGFEDFHEIPLRFVDMLPSLNVPVAVSFTDVPWKIRASAGIIVIETRWAVETVSPVLPLIEPKAPLMVVLPLATLLTRPLPLMLAADTFDEVQVTDTEMSWVLLSLKVPVATNCLVVPTLIVKFAGVTAIDTKAALVIVKDAVPLTLPEVAVIVTVPVPTPVASPLLSTIATEVEDDIHDTKGNSCVLPSSKLPTALNCCDVPRAIDGVAGATEIEIK